MTQCSQCGGSGTITILDSAGILSGVSCPVCSGSGYVGRETRRGSRLLEGFCDIIVTIQKNIDKLINGMDNKRFFAAAMNGDACVIKSYLESNWDANLQDSETGLTALHYAASCGAEEVVDILLSNDTTDVLLKDKKGRLPSEMAFLIAKNDSLGDRLIEVEAETRHKRGLTFRSDLS